MGTRELNQDDVFIIKFLRQMETEQEVTTFLKMLEKEPGAWVLEAIQKRFDFHKIPIDKKTKIALLWWGDGAVGRCAKHVDFIAKKANDIELKEITFNSLCERIYATEMPNF